MNLCSHTFLSLLSRAANEGIRTGLLDLTAPNCESMSRPFVLFDAHIGSIPLRVRIRDWRCDEAPIQVAAWPTDEVDECANFGGAKSRAGDVTASGWIERFGIRPMLSNPFVPNVYIARHRRAELAALPAPSSSDDPYQFYPPYLSFPDAA